MSKSLRTGTRDTGRGRPSTTPQSKLRLPPEVLFWRVYDALLLKEATGLEGGMKCSQSKSSEGRKSQAPGSRPEVRTGKRKRRAARGGGAGRGSGPSWLCRAPSGWSKNGGLRLPGFHGGISSRAAELTAPASRGPLHP